MWILISNGDLIFELIKMNNRFKLLLSSISLAVLAACGGGGGNDIQSTPVNPAPVNPAPVNPAPVNPAPVSPAPVSPAPVNPAPVNPAPVNPAPINPAPVNPIPTEPAALTANCSGAIPSSGMVAISANGDVANANFAVSGRELRVSFSGSRVAYERQFTDGTISVKSNNGSCLFNETTSSGRSVALASHRLGYAFHPVSKIPVLLLGDIQTDVADAAGTYSMVRYQVDQPRNGGTPALRTSYATFIIQANGSWSFYKNGGTGSTLTATGTLEKDTTSNRILFVTGSGGSRVVRGTVFVSGQGDSKILAFAENDPGDAEGAVSGLFVAASQVATSFFGSLNNGAYSTYSTDGVSDTLTLNSTTITPLGKSPISISPDQPITGLYTAKGNNYFLARSGLFAVVSNETGIDSGGYVEIGVIPKN